MTQAPTITSRSNEAEIDRNNLKIAILALVGVAASVFSAMVFLEVLSNLRVDYFLAWAGIVVLFMMLVMLQTVFIKSQGKLQAIMFLQGIAPAVVVLEYIFPVVSAPVFAGLFAFSIFLMAGANRGWQILGNSLSIKFSFIAKNTLPKAITGILIFSSLLAYTHYFTAGKFTDELGRSITYEILASSEPVVRLWFPDLSFSQQSKEFFEGVARAQLQRIPIGDAAENAMMTEFSKLPESQKEKIVVQAGQKVREAMERSFGQFPEREEARNAIFSILKKSVAGAQERFGNVFAIGIIVAAFFAIKGMFALFQWIIVGMSFFAYKFLVVTGFAYTNLENRSREFILLS